jgi:hypothetical protein
MGFTMALTNVTPVKYENYRQALKFTIRTGGNLLVLGQAGIGKTECAQATVQEEGYEVVYINLSVLEYPDLVGLQTITTDSKGKKFVEYASPKFLPLKEKVGTPSKKVIIFDELDKAKAELQNPLLELLQFHTINGAPVDVHACVLTGNLPDEGAFSRPISHALTNRCMVYKLETDFDQWLNWAVGASLNPLVIGFLTRNPECLSKKAADNDPTAYSRESPRSWSQAAKDLDISQQFNRSSDLVDLQTLLIAGRVGTASAIKFKIWLEHYIHIEKDVKDLVEKGKHPKDLSLDKQIVAAIAGCTEVARAFSDESKGKKKLTKEKILENVFGYMKTLTPDIQICAFRSTFSMDMIKKHNLQNNAIFMPVFELIFDIVE